MGAYADSKLYNLLYMHSLARSVLPKHVTAPAITPGMVNTGLFRNQAAWYRAVSYPFRLWYLRPAEEAAEGVVYAMTAAEIEGQTGGYYYDGRRVSPSEAASEDETAERLCQVTSRLIATSVHMDSGSEVESPQLGAVVSRNGGAAE